MGGAKNQVFRFVLWGHGQVDDVSRIIYSGFIRMCCIGFLFKKQTKTVTS